MTSEVEGYVVPSLPALIPVRLCCVVGRRNRLSEPQQEGLGLAIFLAEYFPAALALVTSCMDKTYQGALLSPRLCWPSEFGGRPAGSPPDDRAGFSRPQG